MSSYEIAERYAYIFANRTPGSALDAANELVALRAESLAFGELSRSQRARCLVELREALAVRTIAIERCVTSQN